MVHEHVDYETEGPAEERLRQLRKLAPEVFVDGKLDTGRLKEVFGVDTSAAQEKFNFTWVGKTDAMQSLRTPSRATLIPQPPRSLNFDTTGHAVIEGDNLEVLKLLYKSYFGRVRVIYIDPPYNTGNDFIYPDNYAEGIDAYLRFTGQQDEHGNLLTSNTETDGRFHSKWLSMIYPRLFLGRQLLREDGAIFVSVDDTEFANLRQVMNEVFGQENFVAAFIWEKRTTRENRRVFSFNHDYVVCYARDKDLFQAARNLLPLTEEALARYKNPDNDPRGVWQSVSLNAQAGHATPSQFYKLKTPSGKFLDPPAGRCWAVTKERMEELVRDGRVWFGSKGDGVPRLKSFLSETNQGLTPQTLWKAEEVGTTDSAKKALIELFVGKAVYETPKPVELIRRILAISTNPSGEDIVLDFFAGSGTTGQAVLELNHEDNGTRRFILVQLPEPTPEGSAARKAGYNSISEIMVARIERAIDGLRKQKKLDKPTSEWKDPGYKVYSLAASHYKIWSHPSDQTLEKTITQLGDIVDPLIPGWQPENVRVEVALKEGLSLEMAFDRDDRVKSNKVFDASDETGRRIFICLDDKVKFDSMRQLELAKEDVLVCRDSALTDPAAANLALQCRLKTI